MTAQHPKPAQDVEQGGALPEAAPGHWDTSEGREMALTYVDKPRHWGSGPMSDFALANAVFIASRDDLNLIVMQSSAKDRIRWLSTQLAIANSRLASSREAELEQARDEYARLYMDRVAQLNVANSEKAELERKVDHLEHVIDRDRYIVAAIFTQIKDRISGWNWLREGGRGPYEWDDDRFREEFDAAVSHIEEACEPLSIVAWDKSDCTRIEERVKAAREAARAMLAKPHKPREMILADITTSPAIAELERRLDNLCAAIDTARQMVPDEDEGLAADLFARHLNAAQREAQA